MSARDAFYYRFVLLAVHGKITTHDLPVLVPVDNYFMCMLGYDCLLVIRVPRIRLYHDSPFGKLAQVAPVVHVVVRVHRAVGLAQTVKTAFLLRGCLTAGCIRGLILHINVKVGGQRFRCAVKTAFHVRMRRGPVFIALVFRLRPFLRLAAEKVLTTGLYRALQVGYLPVLFPKLPEQFGHLDCHRRCSLVALAEHFGEFRDLLRQFGYAPVAFLTGGSRLFHALTLVDDELD